MSSLHRELMKDSLPPLPSQFNQPKSRFSGLVPRRNVKDYTPLSWEEYFDSKRVIDVEDNSFNIYTKGSSGAVLLLLHGGGHSALSWALFTKHVCNICQCQVVAIDLRGHGDTKTKDDSNMNALVLAQDVADVVRKCFDVLPPVAILGHSMGGAIAVHLAVQQLLPLSTLAIIDVVEGTAIDALASMQSFLRSRPQTFKSLEEAVEWSVRSGQLKNAESARVSMPGQVRRVSSPEEDCAQSSIYKWRVDLKCTEPHWRGWFENMSSMFLSCHIPKLLILAGIDRLDKQLTIGQMQGKFQMQILSNCGHMVHEDVPDKVAEIIAGFLSRNQLVTLLTGTERHMPSC